MATCARSSSASSLFLGAALVFGLPGAGSAFASDDQPFAGLVEAELQELDRLAAKLEGVEFPEMLRGVLPAQREALATLRTLSSPTLRLYRLRSPLTSLVALELVAEHRSLGEDFLGFEQLWKRTRERNESRPPVVVAGPALLRALAGGARNRSEKYFAAALPYGRASGVVSGLYYVGEAEGELRYEALVGKLAASFPSSLSKNAEPVPAAETTGAALEVLERETVAAFASDPGSQVMIPVSARLKEARELYERSSLDAAALVLLESRLGLSRRLADARDAVKSGAPASIPAVAQPPAASTADAAVLDAPEGSVRRLIAELAREPNMPVNTAVVIPIDVLPLYSALYRSPP